MKGTCKYIVEVDNDTVVIYNEDHGYYVQIFETQDELNEFIKELERARDAVWPVEVEKSNVKNST